MEKNSILVFQIKPITNLLIICLMAPHKTILHKSMLLLLLILVYSCSKDSDLFSEIVQEEINNPDDEGEIGETPAVFQLVDDEFTISAVDTAHLFDVLNNDNIPENSQITIVDTSFPKEGVLVINEDNLLSYTPTIYSNKGNGDVVVDEFSYKVSIAYDGEVYEKEAAVTVTTRYSNIDQGALKAFPTAVGAGAYTTGGRGGTVVHVTNLNDSGAGSLREALLMTVPRIIVFDVSGRIHLSSMIELIAENSNFTVAGQTAPKGGITISGKPIQMGGGYSRANQPCDNAIWRYIRFRNGSYTGVSDMYMHNGFISTGTTGLILDHCSFSFNDDQAISINGNYVRVDNVTIQNCLFSENATSIVLDGNSSGNLYDFTFYNNLFKNEYHRQPNYGGVGQVDIINNIHDNFPSRIVNINKAGTKDVNYIGNWIRTGPTSTTYAPNKVQSPANPSIYTANNYHNLLATIPKLNDQEIWSQFGSGSTDPVPSGNFTTTMHPLLGEAPTIESAQDAFTSVSNNVGSNKYLNADGRVGNYLDSYDTDLIDDTINGVQATLGNKSWTQPTLPENTRNETYDTDNDGMADAWEIRRFGNLQQSARDDFNGDGYTNIEEFINQVDFD